MSAQDLGDVFDELPAETKKKLFFFMLSVIGVYADPNSWFAVHIVSDPPCGPMGKDRRLVDGVRRPGGRARLAMWLVLKEMDRTVQSWSHPETGKQCGACRNGVHADCSGWCFCPCGPCDRPSPME